DTGGMRHGDKLPVRAERQATIGSGCRKVLCTLKRTGSIVQQYFFGNGQSDGCAVGTDGNVNGAAADGNAGADRLKEVVGSDEGTVRIGCADLQGAEAVGGEDGQE